MSEEKRRKMKGTSPEKESSSPRTREADPASTDGLWLLGDRSDQLKEDGEEAGEESDSSIVVRDGRTDHMAKGWTGRQRSHRTHVSGTNAPTRSMSSALAALNRKAGKDRKHRFRDLYRLLDLQALYESYHSLKKRAAPGLDGVSWEDYGMQLDENLRDLLKRLKGKCYRAPHLKRQYIPKGNGKLRKLGMPTVRVHYRFFQRIFGIGSDHPSIPSAERAEFSRSQETTLRRS